MASPSSTALRCRQINDADIDAIATLLARGFPRRKRSYWLRALAVLGNRKPPMGLPKYGYMMESDCRPIGVILLICTLVRVGDKLVPRCNVSSWFVEPRFRVYASLLISHAYRDRNVTYLNISPAPNTWSTIEAQGFLRYCDGLFLSVPMLNRIWGGPRTQILNADLSPKGSFDPYDQRLLLEHSVAGCISLGCATSENAYPFIFRPRIIKGIVPCAHLIYCHRLDDFVRFAGSIGRFLASQGLPLVIVDANGPIPGLIGAYRSGRPKYFKGPVRPRLGDLTYTEYALFGV